MEHLIKNLIEIYAKNDVKDLVLITTGKIIEMDKIIKILNEMLNYNMIIK